MLDTLGNVVPEALASGLAVVSYACAAAQELITTDVNGVLVPVGDESQFISAAVRTAQNASNRDALRSAAAPSVAHLGWESIFDTFVEHLRRVLESQCSGFPIGAPQVAPGYVRQASA